jgi:hypothetical protein
MLHEYAVEPTLLSNWADVRFFLSQFGLTQGRLISRFPKKWKKMVVDGLNACGSVERLKIVEVLKTIDDRLFVRKYDWDPGYTWLRNAEAEHLTRPFRAIIATKNPLANPAVLLGDDVDDTLDYENLADKSDPRHLWRASRSKIIQRTPAEMVEAADKLLVRCSSVLFIDRNFAPGNSRHRIPLEHFLVALMTREIGKLPTHVEVHTGDKLAPGFFQSECNAHLPRIIPAGLTVRIVRWAVDHLHNRYILTDSGGLAFLDGLDASQTAGRREDVVVVLDPDVSASLLHDYDADYAKANPAKAKLAFVDEYAVSGTKAV